MFKVAPRQFKSFRVLLVLWFVQCFMPCGERQVLCADSRGDELAQWLNVRGREEYGEPPEKCDDLTFARRLFLDLVGRVPSVSELRDFESLSGDRRRQLIETLVFGEGTRGDRYTRLASEHLARQWRQVLLPTGTSVGASAVGVENWFATQFHNEVPYDEVMRQLIRVQDTSAAGNTPVVVEGGAAMQYFQLLGGLPENYAGNLSRVMLGVRIECAQCHDHPFTDWKQRDFWGLAAFYSDLAAGNGNVTESSSVKAGMIQYENVSYDAKYLWSDAPLERTSVALRSRLGEWMASRSNPNFAATAVNRFWQHLVGRGLVADVENLDQASPEARRFADEFGEKFAEDGYHVRRLIAAICKSDWYQAVSQEALLDAELFYRPMKSVSPEQVFDSMEQSLHLTISRVDPSAPRWSGERMQLVSRLGESSGATPEDYAAGIPQALLMMNGRLTSEAVDLESSRLLKAVTEAPFFEVEERVETLYMAVLTRRPVAAELDAISAMLDRKSDETAKKRVLGELLWALLNSPEFVLCR